MDRKSYGFAAAVIVAIATGFELVRLASSGAHNAGFTVGLSVVEGAIVVAIGLVAAVGLVLHRRLGWSAGAFAFLAYLSHGTIVRAGGSATGTFFIVAALPLFVCLAKSLPAFRSATPHA